MYCSSHITSTSSQPNIFKITPEIVWKTHYNMICFISNSVQRDIVLQMLIVLIHYEIYHIMHETCIYRFCIYSPPGMLLYVAIILK